MSIKRKALTRAGSLAAAVAVALGALVPALVPMVSAASQVQTRSIQMSDSTPSKTGVDYVVTFTPQTTAAESVVIDFCENSSIIGGTCTTTNGVDTTSATLSAGPTSWVIDHTGLASASTVLLNDSSGTSHPLGTSAVTFTLSAVTNPISTGTFWARVYTYSNSTYGTYSAAATPGNYLDYGGFALSTVSLINISATVMETLTFCVNKTTIATGCSGITTPVSLTLGSGTPKVLSTSNGTGSSDTAFFQVSTNALSGAVVRMRSHNACTNGGLSRDGGTTCPIAGVGTSASPLTTANQALFGVNVAADTPLGSTLGTLTPTSPYNSSSYAMDATTSGNNVAAAAGTKLADTTSAASADLGGVLSFDAEAAATTAAGVYTVNESLIATGTF